MHQLIKCIFCAVFIKSECNKHNDIDLAYYYAQLTTEYKLEKCEP